MLQKPRKLDPNEIFQSIRNFGALICKIVDIALFFSTDCQRLKKAHGKNEPIRSGREIGAHRC